MVLQVDREVVVKEDLKEEVKVDQVEVKVDQVEVKVVVQVEEEQEVVLQVVAEQAVKEEFLEEEQGLTGVNQGEDAI